MIALWHSWSGNDETPASRIHNTLGWVARPATADRPSLFFAPEPQQRPCATILYGSIDNADAIRHELKVPAAQHSQIYQLAVDHWGYAADQKLVGNYAAITCLPDGSVRLARSPWAAPPLHFAANDDRVVASTLHRALFAAGVPQQLDYDRIIDQLAYDFREHDLAGWYHDVKTVPLGAVCIVTRGGTTCQRWYQPGDFLGGQSTGLEEAAQTAYGLLRDSARAAISGCSRPALALSGGLDSGLSACALLDEMPAGQPLDTVTFRPMQPHGLAVATGQIGDEWPLVEQVAEALPNIRPHQADPAQAGFGFRSREMLAAMQIFAPGLANVGMYHGLYAKARALGCDMLLSADLGNQGFSNDARWAYVEYARGGRWGELYRLLANRPGDDRSTLRKILSLAIIPQVPRPLRKALRNIMHPQRADMVAHLSLLTHDALARQRDHAQIRGTASVWEDLTFPRSRREAAEADHRDENGEGADVAMAFTQLYGIGRRDLAAYRPLMEYCLSLPTELFASQGEHRRLARAMASNRLPKSLARNTLHGLHNADWHLHLAKNRKELLAACDAMQDHPFLSQTLDLAHIRRLLHNLPDRPSHDIDRDWPLMLGIPRAMLAAQLVAVVEGRNDF